jgi:TolA-binding protein
MWAPTALAQRPPAHTETTYAEALQLYNTRHYAEAARAFERFRHVYPGDVNVAETYYYEAQARLALEQEDEAARLLRVLQREYPSHPMAQQAQLSLGQYFYENGDYQRARTVLEQVVVRDRESPQAPRALYQLGMIARDAGNDQTALAYFRRVADNHPDAPIAPNAQYAVGTTLVRLEQYDQAARAFEALGQRYPSSPYAQRIGLALADVYYELGAYQKVIDEISRRRAELNPDAQERAIFLLAEAHNQLRNSEDAILNYRRLIEDNPDSPYYRPALYGLAWNYYREDTYQWAADRFARVHADHSDDLAEKATYYEAVNRYLDNRPEAAAALYQDLLDTWPNSTFADQAYYELGIIRYEQRRYQAANEAFQAVVEDYPNAPRRGDAFYMLGNTYIALNNFDGAQESFDRAIALDAAPDSLKDAITFQQAWLQYDQGQYRDAAPAFMSLYRSDTSSDRQEDALFWGAESFYQTGNLARAQSLFQQYLDEYPDGQHVGAARYALGWTAFKQQQYQNAARWFERFLSGTDQGSGDIPYRQDALLRLGDSYYALKRYPAAIRTYRRVEGSAADYALYQTGQALDLADRPQEAIDTLQRLVQQYPNSDWRPEALYQVGFINFQNQNYEAAIRAYRRVIDAYPNDPLAARAQYGIGDARFNAGRMSSSVTAYRRVLNEYPDSPFAADAASSMQYALIAMDDQARATAIIDSFATANPNSSLVDELRFRQAEALYQSGRTDEALQSFRRFVRVSNDDALLPEAYYYLGTIYASREEYDAAEGYLRQVLNEFEGSAQEVEAARRLGEIYLERERYRDALSVYQTMGDAAEDPVNVTEARYGQARALLALNRLDEAEQLMNRTIDQFANQSAALPAQLGLARVYQRQQRFDEAIDRYRTVIRNAEAETGAEALYRLGSLLVDQGQPRRAIEELSRLPTLFGGYPEWIARSYLAQARAYRQLDRPGEAARLYDQIMRDYSGTPFAQTAAREKEAL